MPRQPRIPGSFRLQGKKLFLTFPKPPADLILSEVIERFNEACPCVWIVVGRELHKDGTPHFHLACNLETRLDTTNPRFFDELFYKHGNYQVMRSQAKCIRYCIKDGDFLAEGIDMTKYVKALDNQYEKAMQASTVKEGLAILRKASPGDYMRNYQRYEYVLQKHIIRPTVPKYTLANFNAEPLDLSLPAVIYGETNCGKTQFAMAHFKSPLLISHIDQLKHWDPSNYDGLVFDDMLFSHWPYNSIIHLLDIDEDRYIHCRNTNGFIPQGTKKIFVINSKNGLFPDIFYSSDPLKALAREQKEAIDRRFRKFLVTDDLRRKSPDSDSTEEEREAVPAQATEDEHIERKDEQGSSRKRMRETYEEETQSGDEGSGMQREAIGLGGGASKRRRLRRGDEPIINNNGSVPVRNEGRTQTTRSEDRGGEVSVEDYQERALVIDGAEERGIPQPRSLTPMDARSGSADGLICPHCMQPSATGNWCIYCQSIF